MSGTTFIFFYRVIHFKFYEISHSDFTKNDKQNVLFINTDQRILYCTQPKVYFYINLKYIMQVQITNYHLE